MKALTDKFDTLMHVALAIGIRRNTVHQWKVRGRVSGSEIVSLVMASKGKLKLADFAREVQDDPS
jgi:hypothetical protein